MLAKRINDNINKHITGKNFILDRLFETFNLKSMIDYSVNFSNIYETEVGKVFHSYLVGVSRLGI